ncbi:MAG TPA: helix-turn-helix transcriptional regulator [Hyphomonadaceae bacterium]|nr:helix-turn-helix transcriptional regulator [Hyphomonadaceae bacterium]
MAAGTIELVIVGCALSALACLVFAVARSRLPLAVRVAFGLTGASAAAYVAMQAGVLRGTVAGQPVAWVAVVALICAGMGFFWLLVGALFLKMRLSAAAFAPAMVMSGLGLWGLSVHGPLRTALTVIYFAACIALVTHRLWQIAGRWRGELSVAARRAGAPVAVLVVAVGLYLIVDTVLGLMWRARVFEADLSPLRLAALAGLVLASSFVLLESRRGAFAAIGRERPQVDPARDDQLVVRLELAMGRDRMWAREGLTLEALAKALAAPEYRVRQVIRERYGAAHFAQFINARRIAFAKVRLGDPGAKIADIAFEAGFSSLSVFNRAFREEAGVTPSAWRKSQSVRVD